MVVWLSGMVPQPTTERVRVRRDRPLAIGLAAVGVLILLIAKPWETPAPAATQAAAVASAGSSATPTTTSSPTSDPTPPTTPAPLPTPDIAPLEPAGDFALSAPPDSALARCTYRRARNGFRVLRAVEVLPPVVTLDPQSRTYDIRRIAWRFELEMNSQDRVFDRDWEMVDQSRRQMSPSMAGRPARFSPLWLRYHSRDIAMTSVFRVRVIVEWYTRNFELAGRAELVANRYQEGRDERLGSWPVYCSGVRPVR